MKIKKSDKVYILSGRDRGKTGKVVRVLPAAGKIVVEGVNLVHKRQHPKRQGQKGQTVATPMPLQSSNAQLVCPKCGERTRVGHKTDDQKKARICKKCQAEI